MKRLRTTLAALFLLAGAAVFGFNAAGLSADDLMPAASASMASLPSAFIVAGQKKSRLVTFSVSGPNCEDFERHHVYSKWTLSKVKVVETKFAPNASAEIWADNELVISGEVIKPTQECGSRVNQAHVKVRLEYTENDDE